MTDKQLREIMKRLYNDLNKGLGKDTHAKAIVKCWITYIQDLPNGKGRYLIYQRFTLAVSRGSLFNLTEVVDHAIRSLFQNAANFWRWI